jgi:hypothetical protein
VNPNKDFMQDFYSLGEIMLFAMMRYWILFEILMKNYHFGDNVVSIAIFDSFPDI